MHSVMMFSSMGAIGLLGTSAKLIYEKNLFRKRLNSGSDSGKYILFIKQTNNQYLKILNIGEVARIKDKIIIPDIVTHNLYIDNMNIDFKNAKNCIHAITEEKIYIAYNSLDKYISQEILEKYRFFNPICFVNKIYIKDWIYLYGEPKDNRFIVDFYSNDRDKLIESIVDDGMLSICLIMGSICSMITIYCYYDW